MNAKEVLYSSGNLQETPDTKRLYYKTHGLTDPGEQKTRDYQWKVDPKNHVFGIKDVIELDGAKKTLMSDRVEGEYPKTVFVDKRVEDFRTATNDMLAKGKFRGTLNEKYMSENFAFGIRTVTGNNAWNVGKLLHGDEKIRTEKDLQPDKDLGKSVLNKNKISSSLLCTPDPNRTFGVPTVRTDIPKKAKEPLIEKKVK